MISEDRRKEIGDGRLTAGGYATSVLTNYRKSNNYDKYFVGNGVDIGCGPDPLSKDVWTNIERVVPYDFAQGDANTCSNLRDDSFDFVYSSHCLEHMHDPYVAFENWLRICKSGGYIIVALPHEIFYEKCQWPSRYNGDHKTSWTLEWKSNLPKTIHTPDFLDYFSSKMELVFVKTILDNFNFNEFHVDQTGVNSWGDTICQIEFVGMKK